MSGKKSNSLPLIWTEEYFEDVASARSNNGVSIFVVVREKAVATCWTCQFE